MATFHSQKYSLYPTVMILTVKSLFLSVTHKCCVSFVCPLHIIASNYFQCSFPPGYPLYSEAKYFADQSGVFEIAKAEDASHGNVMRQVRSCGTENLAMAILSIVGNFARFVFMRHAYQDDSKVISIPVWSSSSCVSNATGGEEREREIIASCLLSSAGSQLIHLTVITVVCIVS